MKSVREESQFVSFGDCSDSRDSSSSSDEFKKTPFFDRELLAHELEDGIPIPLLKLTQFFLSKSEFTSTTGIFRVNSTKTAEEQIERMLSKKYYDRLAEITDPFLIASTCFNPS